MPDRVSARALALKAKLFRGFSDASRLAILDALRSGPLSVGDVVQRTGLSQSNVSNHLSCLLECGLVTRVPRGRYAYYQLGDDRVALVLRTADELLSEVAKGIYECSRYNVPGEPEEADA